MSDEVRIVHYLNQFFGGVGGEQEAGITARFIEGPLGPGKPLEAALGGNGRIVGTIVAGDNYVTENADSSTKVAEIVEMIRASHPDVVVAGPAFNAGRYGTACGAVCSAVERDLHIPAVTAMAYENPGVDLFRSTVLIVPTTETAAGMREAIPALARLAIKLGSGEPLGSAAEEGYMPRGIRRNTVMETTGAQRVVALLMEKVAGRPYSTELPLPNFDEVPPAPPLRDLSKALVALVTEGGVVPKGNPDGIEARRASKWAKYSIKGVDDLTSESYTCVHGGFDNQYIHRDPDRLLPLDAMRELEKEGIIGKLYDYYYVTVGAGAPISRARKFGSEIADELVHAGVQGVIFTAT